MADGLHSTSVISIADLNDQINHEPRVLDLRLAEALDMGNRHSIREMIVANMAELEGHGEVSRQRRETSAKGGRPGIEYWLNEAQALLICMFSRTEKAAAVRKSIIEVFMAWRQGKTVHVREHYRSKPNRMPEPEPVGARFSPQSDFIKDMKAAVLSAVSAVEKGKARDFGSALLDVFETIDKQRSEPGYVGKAPLVDWNWKRSDQTRGGAAHRPHTSDCRCLN